MERLHLVNRKRPLSVVKFRCLIQTNTSERRSLYGYLNTVSLESNSQIRINFDGGDLSSDAGLLLFKEFLYKIGAVKLIHRMFKTNDTTEEKVSTIIIRHMVIIRCCVMMD